MREHILFTARDVGAAHQIKHIATAFKNKGYKVSIVASGVAYEVFKKDGLDLALFSINNMPCISHHASEKLIDELIKSSRNIINDKKPDAVFCGLASTDYGIDEAVLYWASRSRLNIPSFQFLDTWGTFNHLNDGYPDLYFAIDQAVLRYCYKGAKAPVKVVGSPKHENYKNMPIMRWRKNIREKFKISDKVKLIGYFGQDPDIPGHTYNFEKFVDSLTLCNKLKSCKLLVVPHPAYEHKYESYWKYLKKIRIDIIKRNVTLSTEQLLSACDLAVTCFSTIGVDHAYLSCYAKEEIGTVLYLLCGKDIKQYMKTNFGYEIVPFVNRNIGFCVKTAPKIAEMLGMLLNSDQIKKEYANNTRILKKQWADFAIISRVEDFLRERKK